MLLGLPLDREAREPKRIVRARPGMGRDLLERLDKHLADPDMGWFDRAVLVRDTRQGFNRLLRVPTDRFTARLSLLRWSPSCCRDVGAFFARRPSAGHQ